MMNNTIAELLFIFVGLPAVWLFCKHVIDPAVDRGGNWLIRRLWPDKKKVDNHV